MSCCASSHGDEKFADSIALKMQSAASDLLSVLSEIDVTKKSIRREMDFGKEEHSGKLESEAPEQEIDTMFESKEKNETSNAISFWELAADNDYINKKLRPDAITYDQARQLGLAPDEE